jgi:hypothetical protein
MSAFVLSVIYCSCYACISIGQSIAGCKRHPSQLAPSGDLAMSFVRIPWETFQKPHPAPRPHC